MEGWLCVVGADVRAAELLGQFLALFCVGAVLAGFWLRELVLRVVEVLGLCWWKCDLQTGWSLAGGSRGSRGTSSLHSRT